MNIDSIDFGSGCSVLKIKDPDPKPLNNPDPPTIEIRLPFIDPFKEPFVFKNSYKILIIIFRLENQRPYIGSGSDIRFEIGSGSDLR